MLEKYLTKIEFNCLDKNIQAITLYDIIQAQLPFNYLESIVDKQVFNHAIFNKRNLYHYGNKQLLLYIRGEGGVGKSKVIKAIHLGYCYLKPEKKQVIAASTGTAMVSISEATIHGALGIHNYMPKQ